MGFFSELIDIFSSNPNSVGRRGENRIANKLERVSLSGYEGITLQNIYIPKGNGTTTEVDLLFITRKGIFIIESKNFSGYIFGDENRAKWTVTLYAGRDWIGRRQVEKYHFYNPVWQNRTHAKYLKQFLGEDVQFISLIVFSDRCELKSINITSPDLLVCQKGNVSAVIKQIWGNYPDTLSEEQMQSIRRKLSPLMNYDEALKQKHIQDINKRLESTDICPYCGGKLVLRTAKQGPYAGNQFYGCSNYPKCKYIKNI